MEKIDETDRVLLRALQIDGATSLDSLAEIASISVNTCWRRIKRMEEAGILSKRVALVDPDKVGLAQTVFVAIRTRDHSAAWLERFAGAVRAIPEVVEFYRMAGDVDYLLKIQVGSVPDYDRVYKALIARVDLADVSATFAMECLKNTTELPI
ncbi:Lrp/AsnC family transcriptional regulator [Hyphomonas sp. WL0036]|uniref:Lrp/AsnC family transcriptional regulator n=1 Tax=Hyphomonas sediminis TaxID=2866160 RepID=UPI001C80D863|nr:Lrp/AsnC family transcriptional regulator [Hyphomonas sediminis]MBY9066218.1 Lrp/AsnC family transcriptional regulator [Hyphomonas sediminis]